MSWGEDVDLLLVLPTHVLIGGANSLEERRLPNRKTMASSRGSVKP